jgi:hypothetical protein
MSDVLVLYQISNEFGGINRNSTNTSNNGNSSSSYNAFSIPRKNNGVTLASIKSHITTYGILPSNGYHWRVRIDDRPSSDHSGGGGGSGDNSGGKTKYSWWDIQDENARLPIKEATPKELKKMFGPPKIETSGDVTQEVTKAAKGAMKFMGKLAGSASTSHHQSGGGHHHGSGGGYEYDDDGMEDDYGQQQQQRTAVICFKVLDLNQVRRDCGGGSVGGGGGGGVRRAIPSSRRTAPPRNQQTAPSSAGAPRVPNNQRTTNNSSAAPRTSAPTGNLMDFGSSSTGSSSTHQQQRNIHHANSMPASTTSSSSTATGKAHPNETRAEKLKREYAKKQAQSNRVWDDVDQRWVEGPVKNGEVKATTATASASVRATTTTASASVATVTKSVKGISLSTTNAVGKSATVQAAVHARVTEMETNKQKAITELRNREAAKANADAEEDLVRQRLDPKLKAWSEEHGKKKQLRALLANLHTILWEGSGWKQVSLADVLDDSKVKRVYHKASRVVHPDKTGHLDAEKRFVAKRVFDALTQAKVEFDEGKR